MQILTISWRVKKSNVNWSKSKDFLLLIFSIRLLTDAQISLRIQSECGKMLTKITPITDTFHAVLVARKSRKPIRFRESSINFSMWCKILTVCKSQKLILLWKFRSKEVYNIYFLCKFKAVKELIWHFNEVIR